FVEALEGDYAFAVINFANPDMVGHTGVIPAVVKAVETADACLGRVVEAVQGRGGVCLVTADHGNAEQMLEADGVSPHTAHTTNPVPLIVTLPDAPLDDRSELGDFVQDWLRFQGIVAPSRVSGKSIVNRP